WQTYLIKHCRVKAEASSRQGLPGSRTQGRTRALAIHGFWAHAGLSCPAPFGRVPIRTRRIGPAIPAGMTVTINANKALQQAWTTV
ncbi:MAG: hypothetical protein KGZ88_01495, partial [Methylomicrobium sp.]|nr:hypothetical protein [Methylomicrobium sp.]